MKISRKEWVQLSAYVDDELRPGLKRKLERRLENRPELRAALEDLRIAKDILSKAPQLKVPRNFTLTADMVGKPGVKSPVRTYRLAAAVLSFLFVAVVFIDLSGNLLMGSMPPAMAPREEELMLEVLPEEEAQGEVLEDEMEEPALLTAEEAVEGEAAVGEGAAPELEEQAEPQDSENAPAADADQAAAEPEAQTKTAGEEEQRTLESQVEENGVDQEMPTLAPEAEDFYLPPQTVAEQPPAFFPISLLRVLEVILGLGALIFSVAAWSRRKI